MAATYQTNGAICDATASQDTGALSTGIACGANWSGQPAQQSATAAAFTADRIGGATAGVVYALGSSYGASKGTRYVQASSSVADGAAVVTGWLNRSGRTMVAGDYCWAVQA